MLVLSLDLRNLVHMLQADSRKHFLARLSCPLLNASDLLEQIRRCGRLGLESEGTIRLYGDTAGDRHARVDVRGPRVELFTKVHGLDALSSKCWTYGGSRRCLSCPDDQPLNCEIKRVKICMIRLGLIKAKAGCKGTHH